MTKRPRAIASAGAFIAALSTSLVAVSTPVIARDLSCSPADASWILTAYLLAISSVLALAGKAADILGRNRVYFTGFVFFVAGGIMCAAAINLRGLIGARVMQGVGAAMLMAVGPAIVTRVTAPEKRARALGIQLAATYFGLTIGPSVGGFLSAALGWHSVFVVVAGAGAIGLVLAIALLPADDADARQPRPGIASLDLPGAALLGVALASLLFVLKRLADGWTGLPVLAIAAFSIVAFVVFARHIAIQKEPLLPLALLENRSFAFGVVGALLLYTVTFTLAYLLPFQLQHTRGLSAWHAGAYMTVQPAAMAVVAPFSGVIADRRGPRLPCVLGMATIALGLLLLAATSAPPGVALVIALGIVGVGAGLYVAPNTAIVMGAAPRDRQASAAATAATARNVGMALGVALGASLDAAVGFRSTLFVAALVGAGAVFLSSARP
jgi:EmrB/QacA subfamily drug resistance transporter